MYSACYLDRDLALVYYSLLSDTLFMSVPSKQSMPYQQHTGYNHPASSGRKRH